MGQSQPHDYVQFKSCGSVIPYLHAWGVLNCIWKAPGSTKAGIPDLLTWWLDAIWFVSNRRGQDSNLKQVKLHCSRLQMVAFKVLWDAMFNLVSSGYQTALAVWLNPLGVKPA